MLFGLGALCGPMIAGRIADRTGFRRAFRGALVVQAVSVVLPALAASPVVLVVSSVLTGAMVPGVVPLVLGRVHELIPDHDPWRRAQAWSYATTAFALGQAGGAYGFSFLYGDTGNYPLLFALGGVTLTLALALDLMLARMGEAPAGLDAPTGGA
jgi:predicted MFS family arabinose efflux permease